MRILAALTFALIVVAVVVMAQGATRVLNLDELTYTEIDRLDRNRTVFIVTFGNLEEHGPHLPVGSDAFQAVAFRDGVVARLLKSHPDRTFVIAPVVPLGEGGANDVAGSSIMSAHTPCALTRFATWRSISAARLRSRVSEPSC